MNYKTVLAKVIAVFVLLLGVYVFLAGEKVPYALVRSMYDVMGAIIIIGVIIVLVVRQE